MFRIRQVTSTALPVNKRIVEEVLQILNERLPGISHDELRELPERLHNPLGYELHPLLFVADRMRGKLLGFALVSHVFKDKFCLLDYIASSGSSGGGGVGAALYAHVREVAKDLKVEGLFYECLPDEPELCSKAEYLKPNRARLKFYERFGARPILGTAYETPVKEGDLDAPYLVFDDLGSEKPLRATRLRKIVSTILSRKYSDVCSPEYREKVVRSIKEDPVRIREPRYIKKRGKNHSRLASTKLVTPSISLVVNDRHLIHHVKERGYVEAPARVGAILKGIERLGVFQRHSPRTYPESVLSSVHDQEFVRYLKSACEKIGEGKSLYPYVFPVRNNTRPPLDQGYAAGYYCIDTFTPLNRNAFLAAKRGVDCTLTATELVVAGERFAYALVRPPGHHAERALFGGFCYFCNSAIAAEHVSRIARVAILDIDYHHGNGQQDIFYSRSDVLTVSIHADPKIAYPFFSGFEEEVGHGDGIGYNTNIVLPEKVDGKRYRCALQKALSRIKEHKPEVLIVSFGLDVAKGDPTGTWSLEAPDFEENGRLIGALGLPTVIVQEGGYKTNSLGKNARFFFQGLLNRKRSQ